MLKLLFYNKFIFLYLCINFWLMNGQQNIKKDKESEWKHHDVLVT
jgi:hypothetical protein